MRAAVAGLAVLLFGCAVSPPETRSAVHVVSLHPYAGKLRYVEASSPAHARLLFDTAGGLTLFSPAIASAAECHPYTKLVSLRMSGERFEVDGCGPSRLAIGALELQPEAGIFDLMALLPKELPRIDGLVSLQTFADHVVTIDLARNTVEVAETIDHKRLQSMQAIPIRFSRSFAGAGLDIFVRVEGTRGPLWFELDSGNLDSVRISKHVLDQLGLVTSQTESLQQGNPANIALNIEGLGPVTVEARGADIIYDGALNAAFLESAVFVLDLKHTSAWGKLNDR